MLSGRDASIRVYTDKVDVIGAFELKQDLVGVFGKNPGLR